MGFFTFQITCLKRPGRVENRLYLCHPYLARNIKVRAVFLNADPRRDFSAPYYDANLLIFVIRPLKNIRGQNFDPKISSIVDARSEEKRKIVFRRFLLNYWSILA